MNDTEYYGSAMPLVDEPATFVMPLHASAFPVAQELEANGCAYELMVDGAREFFTVEATDEVAMQIMAENHCKQPGALSHLLDGGLYGVAIADAQRYRQRRKRPGLLRRLLGLGVTR